MGELEIDDIARKKLDNIWQNLSNSLNLLSEKYSYQNPTSNVFHYTSIENLVKIIESQELWLGNYLQLNDTSEIMYGIDFVQSFVKNKFSNHDLWDKISNKLKFVMTKRFEIFTASFCLKSNFLPAWRFYGNDAKGAAIGFSPELFSEKYVLSSNENEPLVGQVNYGTEKLRSICEDYTNIINETYNRYEKELAEYKEIWFYHLCNAFLELILPYLAHTKHEDYIQEHEYRMHWVHGIQNTSLLNKRIPQESKFYKTKGSKVLSYAKFKFLPKHIKQVFIGPSSNQKEIERFITEILFINGFENVEVKKSLISYNAI